MPIIDPVYTLLLCAGLWLAARALRERARTVAVVTLLVSSAYLAFAWSLNAAAEREARQQLAAEGIDQARIAAFPTLLQLHYRRLVVRTETEDRVGYVSMWHPCPIQWQRAPRYEGPAIDQFLATREGRIFDWFTMGWIRFQSTEDAGGRLLRAIDLRYGFTDDPDHSIFNVAARLEQDGASIGPIRPGTEGPDRVDGRLAGLFQEAYAPFCSIG
jgi:hypothetical protein